VAHVARPLNEPLRRLGSPLCTPPSLACSGFAPLLWVAAGLAFAIYPPPLSQPASLPNLYLALALIFVIFLSGTTQQWP
jgi:hypothetical protein